MRNIKLTIEYDGSRYQGWTRLGCNFMRLNTLEKLYNTLKYEWPEVKVDEAVAKEAIKPIQKMLEISAKLGL